MATTIANTELRLLWALDARQVIKALIVRRRKELGLTQEDVAERAKQPLRSYQRWEAGEVLPRRHAREKVARALELEADALEPPAEPQDPESEKDVHAALEEVLTRLTRIEAFLSPHHGSKPSDEQAAELGEAEAQRMTAKQRGAGTARRGGRRGTPGR